MSETQDLSMPLKGKLAIVTGSSRGIGAGIAWELARRGADVCLTYTSEKSAYLADELRTKIANLPHKPKAYVVKADLSTIEGPKSVVSQLAEQIEGTLRVHILVNNAGFTVMRSLSEVTLDDYHVLYDLNVQGLILMTQAVLPYLPPKGRIINIGSGGSRQASAGLTFYASTKAAVDYLTRGWANEMGGNGTTVNCVAPGPVGTDLLDAVLNDAILMPLKERTPLENRIGTTKEIGSVVAWLASDDASWITGQVISATGGLAMF